MLYNYICIFGRLPHYLRGIIDSEDPELPIGCRKTPITWILYEWERVKASDAEIRDRVDELAGCPVDRNPILAGLVLVEIDATYSHDGGLINSYEYLIESGAALAAAETKQHITVATEERIIANCKI